MSPGFLVHALGILYLIIGSSLLLPLTISYLYTETTIISFLIPAILCLGTGVLFYLPTCRVEKEITHKEAIFIATVGLMTVSIWAAMPYILSGAHHSFIDAYLESVAAFTTTNATAFGDIGVMSKGILFWRSLSQWLGGMGFIIFSIAILPLLRAGGMGFYRSDASLIKPEKFRQRMVETFKRLWYIYLFLTVVEMILLYLSGLDIFDSVIYSMSTISTGGFVSASNGLIVDRGIYIKVILIFFMFVSGTNMTLHYLFLQKGAGSYLRNREFRVYLAVVLIAGAIVSLDLFYNNYHDIARAVGDGYFHVVSMASTTGFVATDYGGWTSLSRHILLILIFIGGSTYSAAGGIKVFRVMLLFKKAQRQVHRLFHPHAVMPVKLEGEVVDSDVISGVSEFFFLYTGIFVIASIAMAAIGFGLTEAISMVATTLSNVGPYPGTNGILNNYASIPESGKTILILTMLLGRLEIFVLITIFTPSYWKR